MAIDQRAKDALRHGSEYMPGVPLIDADEESTARAICLDGKPGEADRFYQSGKKTSAKGNDEVHERMAKVRAAKGKNRQKEKEQHDDESKTEPVGLLSKGDGRI